MNSEERRIAYEVRRALDESLKSIPAGRLNDLQLARKRALQRHKIEPARGRVWAPALALFRGGVAGGDLAPWVSRVATLLPAVAMVFALFAVYDHELQTTIRQKIEANAEIDAMVLADPLPLEAYTDPGFAGYLAAQEARSLN